MRKGILLSMLGFGLAAFLMGSSTMAWFTDNKTVDTTFTSGTIVIGAANAGWTSTYNNMAPGQTVSANITVSNPGTLTLKYRMYAQVNTGSDATLASTLLVRVRQDATTLVNWMPLDAFLSGVALVRDGANTVAPGGSQVLTVDVQLPPSAGNNVKAKSVSVTFEFDATQPENTGWSQ